MKKRKEFEIIECSGKPYDIGFQRGSACKEHIIQSINMFMEGLRGAYGVGKEQAISFGKKFLPLAEEFDPDQIEEFKGAAEGAEVSFDEVFILTCMFELGEYFPVLFGLPYKGGLCTSFAATGDATKGGETIAGQNIDWTPGTTVDLLRVKPSKGPSYMTLSMGGFELDWVLNSGGLFSAVNLLLTPPERQRILVPYSMVFRKAMRQKCIGDAVGVICSTRSFGMNHLLASDEGEIIDIETTPDDFNFIYPERDMIAHSNHYLVPRFRSGDIMRTIAPDSYLRVYRLRRLMEKHYSEITVETMNELLTDHADSPSSICRHIDPDKPPALHFETLVSIIAVPKGRAMYIAYGQPCKYEYVKYAL